MQVYRGGVNHIYQGPFPTVPGILKVPLELERTWCCDSFPGCKGKDTRRKGEEDGDRVWTYGKLGIKVKMAKPELAD